MLIRSTLDSQQSRKGGTDSVIRKLQPLSWQLSPLLMVRRTPLQLIIPEDARRLFPIYQT